MKQTPAMIRAARAWGVHPVPAAAPQGFAALVTKLRDAGESEDAARERARSMVDALVTMIYQDGRRPSA